MFTVSHSFDAYFKLAALLVLRLLDDKPQLRKPLKCIVLLKRGCLSSAKSTGLRTNRSSSIPRRELRIDRLAHCDDAT